MNEKQYFPFFLVLIDFVHNFQMFWVIFFGLGKKNMVCSDRSFVFIPGFFFVRLIVFELWSILFSKYGHILMNFHDDSNISESHIHSASFIPNTFGKGHLHKNVTNIYFWIFETLVWKEICPKVFLLFFLSFASQPRKISEKIQDYWTSLSQ